MFCGLSLSSLLLLLFQYEGTNANYSEVLKRQTVHGEEVSHQLVDSIKQLVLKLQWRRIILIFEKYDYSSVRELLLHRDIDILPASFLLQELDQELMSASGFMAFLQSVHQRFFPELNFILLAEYERAASLLTIVDTADKELNRTTDFRHFSFWIQACTSVCQPPSGPHSGIQHLENVILMSPSTVHNERIDIWELIANTKGRMFSLLRNDWILSERDIFQNTKYGLNQRNLIVSTKEDIPFVTKTRKGFDGYCIEVLKYLASNLNFSYEVISPADNQWGAVINGTWNGLTGQLQKREVDLVISTLSVHKDREKVMDFLYPPFVIEYDGIIFKLVANDDVRWEIFFGSFKSAVFVVLGVTFLAFSGFAYTLMRYSDHYTLGCKEVGLMDLLLYCFGVLLSRGVEMASSRQSIRLLLFTWGLFSVVIAAAYSANLVAIFAVHRQKLPFNNLAELVRQTDYKWGLWPGNIREHIFRMSKTGDLALAWAGIVEMNKSDPEVLSPDLATHMRKLKTEKYAFFEEGFVLRNLQQEDCSLKKVGEDIIMHQFAVGVPTGYPLSREIEEELSILADSSLLNIWGKRWGITKPLNCSQEDRVASLSFKDVASVFVILGAGLGFAGIVLLIEKLMNIRN